MSLKPVVIFSLVLFFIVTVYSSTYLGYQMALKNVPTPTSESSASIPPTTTPKSTLKTYTNPQLNLSFRYPTSWQLYDNKTETSVDPQTNKPVYSGSLKLTKKNVSVEFTWGDGFGGGNCKSMFNGQLKQVRIIKNIYNPVEFCEYIEQGRTVYESGTGDSTILQGNGYSLVFKTSPFAEADRPEIDSILASLSLN